MNTDSVFNALKANSVANRLWDEANRFKSPWFQNSSLSNRLGPCLTQLNSRSLEGLRTAKSTFPERPEETNEVTVVRKITSVDLCQGENYVHAEPKERQPKKLKKDEGNVCEELANEPEEPTNSFDSSDKLCRFHEHVITIYDYQTLGAKNFLNDVIIDFYLSYLWHHLEEPLKSRIHVFSSLFYSCLARSAKISDETAPRDSSTNAYEKRYAGVTNWTRKVDIFNKDLIFFPICENHHWYLVVVRNPRRIAYANKKRFASIVVMDSLKETHSSTVSNIRSFLKFEFLQRKRIELNFEDVERVPLKTPKVPQQSNWYDCGIFLLHYAELILRNVDQFMEPDLDDLSNWFSSSDVVSKREDIALIVRNLSGIKNHCKFPCVQFPTATRIQSSLLSALHAEDGVAEPEPLEEPDQDDGFISRLPVLPKKTAVALEEEPGASCCQVKDKVSKRKSVDEWVLSGTLCLSPVTRTDKTLSESEVEFVLSNETWPSRNQFFAKSEDAKREMAGEGLLDDGSYLSLSTKTQKAPSENEVEFMSIEESRTSICQVHTENEEVIILDTIDEQDQESETTTAKPTPSANETEDAVTRREAVGEQVRDVGSCSSLPTSKKSLLDTEMKHFPSKNVRPSRYRVPIQDAMKIIHNQMNEACNCPKKLKKPLDIQIINHRRQNGSNNRLLFDLSSTQDQCPSSLLKASRIKKRLAFP